MPEIRYDIFSGNYAIIASERAKRPSDFRSAQEHNGEVPEIDPGCPFCVGNEGMTPPEVYALRDRGNENEPGWRIRVVPNKFPALSPDGDGHALDAENTPGADDTCLYWRMPGTGAHEVVIESTKHNGTLGMYTAEELTEILETIRRRYLALSEDKRIAYVQIFRNWGPRGGASLRHPHFQIVGLPLMPPAASNELRRFKEYESKTGRCLMCDYIEREIEKDERVAIKNEEFIVVCPFASRFSFETLIVPRKHSGALSELDGEKARYLAEVFSELFGAYEDMFPSLSYNVVFHTLPAPRRHRKLPNDHWHIHVYPVLNVEAGLEKGASVWINPTPPELAAAQFGRKG